MIYDKTGNNYFFKTEFNYFTGMIMLTFLKIHDDSKLVAFNFPFQLNNSYLLPFYQQMLSYGLLFISTP